MEHNEHILTYKAHKNNDYLNGLLSYMNECIEDHECYEAMIDGSLYETKTYGWYEDDNNLTARQNYFVELHYAKGRDIYPDIYCSICDVEIEYVCRDHKLKQTMYGE